GCSEPPPAPTPPAGSAGSTGLGTMGRGSGAGVAVTGPVEGATCERRAGNGLAGAVSVYAGTSRCARAASRQAAISAAVGRSAAATRATPGAARAATSTRIQASRVRMRQAYPGPPGRGKDRSRGSARAELRPHPREVLPRLGVVRREPERGLEALPRLLEPSQPGLKDPEVVDRHREAGLEPRRDGELPGGVRQAPLAVEDDPEAVVWVRAPRPGAPTADRTDSCSDRERARAPCARARPPAAPSRRTRPRPRRTTERGAGTGWRRR